MKHRNTLFVRVVTVLADGVELHIRAEIDHLQNVVEIVFQIAVADGDARKINSVGLQQSQLLQPHGAKRGMRGDRTSGLVMCQRGGNKHLLFQRRNLPFAGADLRDDPGFQLRAIDTLLNFIDHLLRQFLHAAGRHMFREKRVLVITGTGHHVDPGFAHYIEHKLCIAPHVTVGHLNHITHTQCHQVVHLLANERILIKAAVHVVFKAGEINMQMLMGQGVAR